MDNDLAPRRFGPSRLLKKSERAVKNHEQIGIKTGPFNESKCGDIEFFNSLLIRLVAYQ
jgi:hypothetical protein